MTLPASLFLDERPLAQAIAPPPEPPGDEPQSLVLAVELGQVAQQLRHRWARLDLNLPERGTWPALESWRPALHEAPACSAAPLAAGHPAAAHHTESGAGRTPRPAAPGRGILGQARKRRPAAAGDMRSRPTTGRLAGRTAALAPRARIGAALLLPAQLARPGADEGRQVEFRRRAQLAHQRVLVGKPVIRSCSPSPGPACTGSVAISPVRHIAPSPWA